jgi:cob(I)alamin adenosyltransferase
MVVLNRIYTRTGDDGTTALGTGERVAKHCARIEAFGTVDEANAAIGLARQHLAGPAFAALDAMLARVQNDLFDLGADLCVPEAAADTGRERLRILPAQTARLESDIDGLNAGLAPLRSFVLPAGHPGAAGLHLARTVTRRAERRMVALAADGGEQVGAAALNYINRLSDLLFVASRWVNAASGAGEVLWQPGATRPSEKD